MESSKVHEPARAEIAHIGKSVSIKGELSGSEDLYLDGEVEGQVELPGHTLIIGPNGRVRARLQAREIIVHGGIIGGIRAAERVELKKSAVVTGDIGTRRIAVEEGAYFKGKLETLAAAPAPAKTEVTAHAVALPAPAAAPQGAAAVQTRK